MSKKNRSGLSVLLGQQKQYVPHGIQLSAVEYILTLQLKNNPCIDNRYTPSHTDVYSLCMHPGGRHARRRHQFAGLARTTRPD